MTASSVTGVGRGSAEGKSRGSSSQSLSVHKLVGPRVVAAGVVRDVVGTTFRVFLPPIPEGLPNYEPVDDEPGEEGDSDDYIITLTNSSSTHCYVSDQLQNTEDGSNWTFEFTCGDGDYVWWSIIHPGY